MARPSRGRGTRRAPGVRGGAVCSASEVAPKTPSTAWKPEDELCAFFRGTGTDIECRSLDEILAWEDVLLEVCHDYIQWLFPSDEASRLNSDAPLLSEELQAVFRTDQVIQANYKRGVHRFLKFMGLVMSPEDEHPMRITKADNFEKRMLMCWKGPANHNWMRLSRVLRSLDLVGLHAEQAALVELLSTMVIEHPNMIEGKTVDHWARASGGRLRLSPPSSPKEVFGEPVEEEVLSPVGTCGCPIH
jgi:hypothetical protein